MTTAAGRSPRDASGARWERIRSEAMAFGSVLTVGCAAVVLGPLMVGSVLGWPADPGALDRLAIVLTACSLLLWTAFALNRIRVGSAPPDSRSARVRGRIDRAAWVFLGTVAAFAIASALTARTLVTERQAGADVQYLFDPASRWPPAIHEAAAGPLAFVAWREESRPAAWIGPATPEALRVALESGRVIVVACHGSRGTLRLSGRWIGPAAMPELRNPPLQGATVYLGACEAGQLAAGWAELFAPAVVITHARTTTTIEHWFWLWFVAPRLLTARST